MTRVVVFLLATFAAWPQLGAQANPSSSAQQPVTTAPTATDDSAQGTLSVVGCLDESQAGGGFTLTDASGREYVLADNTGALTGHNQQEIQVTGQQVFSFNSESGTSGTTPAQGQASSTPAGAQAGGTMIQVRETRIVSDHCSSAAGTREKLSAEASDPPAGDEHSLRSPESASQPRSGQTESGVDEAATTGARELPQTSTILPLLGLIGLGSLVAGFFARR